MMKNTCRLMELIAALVRVRGHLRRLPGMPKGYPKTVLVIPYWRRPPR